MLVQSAAVEARTESYDGPCNEGDWEKNGGCCPPDTEYMVHNDCTVTDITSQVITNNVRMLIVKWVNVL